MIRNVWNGDIYLTEMNAGRKDDGAMLVMISKDSGTLQW
jgi:hypothetical protein